MFCDINCKMSALLKNNLRNYRKSVLRRQTTGRISSCGIWARRKFLIFLVTLLCDVMIVIRDQDVSSFTQKRWEYVFMSHDFWYFISESLQSMRMFERINTKYLKFCCRKFKVLVTQHVWRIESTWNRIKSGLSAIY